MRNEGTEPTAEGPEPDDGSTYTSAVAHRPRRPKQQLIAGAAGVLAVLGVGGVILATQGRNEPVAISTADPAPPPGVATVVPSVPLIPTASGLPVPPSATAGAAPSAPAPAPVSPRPGAAAPTAATRAVPAPAATARSERNEQPGAAALPQPSKTLRAQPQSTAVKDSEVQVVQTASPDDKERLKVASARADLTGYRELSWVTEENERIGDVRCTNRIRLSPDLPAQPRSTLLICWRVSATRSVYTVAVNVDGKPSRVRSIEALEAAWRKLG
ncbi:hypothetical protein [Catenuloplanes atrovinosus]|uniref:Type IV secretory pathway VirB10-like protein n=1 Tax=Catenuloplanes atrovinosus TaxID=137266 RepID=A0AAE4CEU2_9ACTN|nr:hypothetical protein [Catenuloplanes atrovinosus]MDR7280394.1 type IV secretory pathway VirB10-like protein [Catenuloplanes atrovinosus]